MRYCFGNWKLNKGPKEAQEFLESFSNLVQNTEVKDFCIFPQALSAFVFSGQEQLFWGGQNIYSKTEGAYTGENSAKVLKEMGAQYVLVGHSERRSLFSEASKELNLKVKLSLGESLTPVFCIGETDEQNQKGQTQEVLKEQITEGLKDVDLKKVILAYEPVWAIGTGRSASPEEASKVHDFIRDFIGNEITPILYGGSVNPENATSLYQAKNINGFLIGGASLNPESFYQIYKNMGVV